jgi:hypothetical protein
MLHSICHGSVWPEVLVKTLTLRLDDETWERLCRLQTQWGLSLDDLLTSLVERLSRPDVLAEQTIGAMRDEADLESHVLAGIMADREGR